MNPKKSTVFEKNKKNVDIIKKCAPAGAHFSFFIFM